MQLQVPLGIQIACAIRIGQYLGAGNAAGAKTVARLSLLLVGGLDYFISCFLKEVSTLG